MLRIFRSLIVAVTTAAGAVLLGAVLSPAGACPGASGKCVPSTPSEPSSSGQTVTVRVTGSLVSGGSSGSTGGATTVSVPTPCVWFQGWTGKEYADDVRNGTISGGSGGPNGEGRDWTPFAGYQQHKDDTEGHWYFPGCSNVTGMTDREFNDYVQDYFERNDGVYVEAGETPPVPDVPPEVLLMAAEEAMEVPEPEFEHNPDTAGDFDTLVNLDTWFWLTDPTQDGSVTASIPTGDSVTVDASLADVNFSSPTAGTTGCAGTGTEWQQGATSDCTLTFDTAGPTEVTADTQWDLTWSYNGDPQGAIDPLVGSFTEGLVIAESQALVDEVG